VLLRSSLPASSRCRAGALRLVAHELDEGRGVEVVGQALYGKLIRVEELPETDEPEPDDS
jgi:hypothetical protein